MKIVMLGHKRIPGREGGIEVVVEELSTRMVSKGNQVTVYNRQKKGYPKINNYKGVRIITIPTIQTKNMDAIVYSFLASIRASFSDADVIHYHAIGPASMVWIPHLFHKKTIVTVHGLNYKTPKWKGFGAKYIQWGEKVVAKYADEIITLSHEQQLYFKVKYDRDVKYIPNGTEIKEIKEPEIISQKWSLKKKGYILFLSRVVPGKGLENLIEAFKNINTNLKLVIAGGSEYAEDFRTKVVAMAKNDNRIIFLGHVEGEQINELYSNAFLFVFPSEAEGMPMCLLEALSYDTPCLVSDIPENEEVGRSYVQKFKTGDTEDLRKQLINCIHNKDLLFKKGSREYIKNEYDWNKIVDDTLKAYYEIR